MLSPLDRHLPDPLFCAIDLGECEQFSDSHSKTRKDQGFCKIGAKQRDHAQPHDLNQIEKEKLVEVISLL